MQAKVLFKEGREAVFWNSCARKWEKALTKAVNDGGNVHDSGKDAGTDVVLSIGEIKGQQGYYGIGVILDSDRFGDADNAERKRIAKDFVVNHLAGKSFVAYDDNGNPVEIALADKEEVVRKRSGKMRPVIEELYRKNIHKDVKQESVVLANELIESSAHDGVRPSEYSHDWVDDYGKNDWEYRTVFLQQKDGTVWEATLNIANAADGRKLLYDIDPIIKKEDGPVKSGSPSSGTAPSQVQQMLNREMDAHRFDNTSLSQDNSGVKNYSMQETEKDAEDVSFMVSDSGEGSASGRTVGDIVSEQQGFFSRFYI